MRPRIATAPTAQFRYFAPFREFVSGPLHAGTFGPEVRSSKAPEPGQRNLPPSMGLRLFGKVEIAGDTGVMTVSLMDVADTVLWSTGLMPERA